MRCHSKYKIAIVLLLILLFFLLRKQIIASIKDLQLQQDCKVAYQDCFNVGNCSIQKYQFFTTKCLKN